MLQLFKIYEKITNEDEAEGVIKVASFILIGLFTLGAGIEALSAHTVPYFYIICTGLTFYTLKRKSKISSIILVILMLDSFINLLTYKLSLSSLTFLGFLVFQVYKMTEGVYKLKKYQKEYL